MIVALCTFLVFLAAPTLAQDPKAALVSPCPEVFTYEPKGEPYRWYGVIYLSTDTATYGLWLNILLDDKVDLLGNWLGEVTTNDNMNFRIDSSDTDIKPGSDTNLRFFVQYKNKKKPPRLLAIRLNGRDICIVKPSDESTAPKYNGEISSDSTTVNGRPLDRTIDAALKILQSPKSTNPRGPNGESLCGKVVSDHWPWQIALYQLEIVQNKYICGGTLVTARHVITAAHCIINESTDLVVDPRTLSVYLGKQNLWTSIDGVQVMLVTRIRLHPHYKVSTHSNNLAILELHEPAIYTDWVRPACLWPKDEIDLDNVVGKKGLVLSWGFDGEDNIINDLHQEEMPVVSHTTCMESGLNIKPSEPVYCAGNRDENSLCASAGSGMVFKIGSTWHLRGFTSLAATGFNGKRCDTSYYVIFTDLAQYLPWINDIVFDF
ncbi:hypothetical protein PYW08_008158 [Mythimna loreyi]|uniref:Uncharacterized protein n=1 Tax=Mythimna loreyi TaxID=667449 RepID=A0ACC2QFM2_9NEOP|nr:hypothetical protein PYW08_008158 [Mythimna loreyi]